VVSLLRAGFQTVAESSSSSSGSVGPGTRLCFLLFPLLPQLFLHLTDASLLNGIRFCRLLCHADDQPRTFQERELVLDVKVVVEWWVHLLEQVVHVLKCQVLSQDCVSPARVEKRSNRDKRCSVC